MLRDLDPGPSGKCMDVDSGSRLLAGTWSGLFEPGTLLWPLTWVGGWSLPG